MDDQFAGTYSDVSNLTLKDAIPCIESHYSVYTDADHRGLYGYFWGGMYCLSNGLRLKWKLRF